MVQGLIRKQKKQYLTIYINHSDFIRLKKIAKTKNSGLTTMARVLLLNGLEQIEKKKTDIEMPNFRPECPNCAREMDEIGDNFICPNGCGQMINGEFLENPYRKGD